MRKPTTVLLLLWKKTQVTISFRQTKKQVLRPSYCTVLKRTGPYSRTQT